MDFLIPILNAIALGILAILMMVGLIEAPWQVLLLILVLTAVLCQWLIRRNHLQAVLKDLEGNGDSPSTTDSDWFQADEAVQRHSTPTGKDKSQLSYRGASYQAPSADRSTHSLEIVGKYRGGLWRSGS
ncbi:DUF4278 domain-containing protein [Egbenema bharatensis]|uniref:DUF4278 domain-containing protein n=1 Tax=Egbenema bharatensis TaxID=3463334 RepID=UPI003A870DA5